MSAIPNSTLAGAEQRIADLQRQLAECRAERDEALDQQTATAEVLQVINSSPGDLAPVFDAILAKAMNLCGAAFGALMSYDGERVSAVATRGLPPQLVDAFRQPVAPRRDGDAPYARFLRGESLLHIIDMAADDVLPSLASRPRALVEIGGARTGLEIPLRQEGAVLGSIWLYRQEVRPFGDKQIALLQNFAAQAVIAMENARLITETREALEQQTATAEVLQVINSSPGDLAPVFDAMLEKAMRLCEADYGHILTFDGQRFHPAAIRGEAKFVEWRRRVGPVQPDSGADASPLGRVMQGERVARVADATHEKAYHTLSSYRELVDISGIRSQAAVALRKEDVLLGAIVVYRREVRPFSDKEIGLLQNFAAQAVIAMENARLITETREALEQQTATAEVLQVINSSPGDLAPVFDAMLEKAVRLCDAEIGTLWISDGERSHAVASRGAPPAYAEFLNRGPHPRPTRTRGIAHIPDVRETEFYRDGNPLVRAGADLGGVRTMLAVPLRKDEVVLGRFSIYRQEVRPFTEKQISLLQNFAAQAVIAMENARLITETHEALEQQTATAEVLQVINSSPGDLSPVFEAMLEKAMRLCEADFGVLNTYDGKGFHRAAARGEPPAHTEWRLHRRAVSGPGTGHARIVAGEDVIHTLDLMADAPYRDGDPDRRAFVDLAGARTGLIVALRKEGTLLGIIRIYRQEVQPFTDKQIALLQNFAAQAVIAMENARLINETREALDQQTATAEVLQVINSSPGDLAPVFDAMLEKAHSLCDVSSGSLQLYDSQYFHTVATRGMSQPLIDLLREPYSPGPDGLLQPLIAGARFLQIDDQAAELATQTIAPNPRIRLAVELDGIRTALFVPLRKNEALLGMISCARHEVRPFTDKQIALLENFAAQAVIAMENARLITETREALEQQTATAEVLQVINSSPGDLAPVFDAMLDNATRLCEAVHGTLATYDGEFFRFVAVHGEARMVEEEQARGLLPPSFGVTWPRLLCGDSVVHVTDVTDTDLYRTGHQGARWFVDIGGGRTLLTIGLRKEDALLGALTVYRQEVRPFSDQQIALLQSFAAQAVIAMENARLITETREALEQQTATAEVLQVINSSPGDLSPVFEAMLEKATTLCDAAFGIMLTWDGQCFHRVAFRGASAELIAALRQPNRPVPGSMAEQVVNGARMICAADIRQEPAYRVPGAPIRALVDIGGARSYVSIALRKDDALLGLFSIYRQEVRPFSDKQIALLQNFAAQAVIAMENARLLGELRQRTEEVGALNRDLEARVAEQVDELGRVGRLKRFLAPQLAELIVSHGDEKILESHRREIVVVFCDLRGYTAFTETAEPEEVLDFLRQYHGALGPLVSQFEGTLDQFSGDGIMVFFNDPVPCPDPAERAVKMAMAMREAAGTLIAAWRRRGRMLGFGAGIAQGYATLGQIGFSERSGYTAIGTVCNLAARLCAEAKDEQILIAQLVAVAVEKTTPLEEVGELTLKGLTQPVVAYNVPLQAAQPALRVIEGGPQSV